MSRRFPPVIVLALLGGCEAPNVEPFDDEEELDPAMVPAPVMASARQALPEVDFHAAEVDDEDGTLIYELEGRLDDGRSVEIELDASGEVLEIEHEDEADLEDAS